MTSPLAYILKDGNILLIKRGTPPFKHYWSLPGGVAREDESPEEACSRFLDLPYLLFLDSAGAGHNRGRFSFLTADPSMVVRSKGPVTSVWQRGSLAWRAAPGGALRTVEHLLSAFAAERVEGLPPFQGGAAGYLGYEYGGRLERLPPPPRDNLALPDMVFGIYDWVVAWDHATGQAWILSTGIPETASRH